MRPGSGAHRSRVAETSLRACGAKVGEIKGEHWEVVSFRDRHHRRIDVSKVEVRERGVDLHHASQQAGREVNDGTLSCRDGHRPWTL